MARSNEPFWWTLFAAGMGLGAFVVPALIVLTGLLIPWQLLGSSSPEKIRLLIDHPITRTVLFVVVSLSFFHGAHRLRFTLVDLGLKAARVAIAVICYGAAIAGTVVAGLIALRLV